MTTTLRTLTCMFLPTALALTGLACTVEGGGGLEGEDFREAGLTFAQTWHVEGERRFANAECEGLMTELCAELSAGECAVAQARTICEPLVSGAGEHQGAKLVDGYGARVDWTGVEVIDVLGYLYDVRWTGFSEGDKGTSTLPAGASPAELCETMGGLKQGGCLTMATAAELARDRADEILEVFPGGGVGTLTEQDGVLVISGFTGELGGDLFTATADALDWRLPKLDGVFVLGEGTGSGTPNGGCTIGVAPNGTVTVASATAVIQPEPVAKVQSPSTHNFSYSMSSPGANYDRDDSHVVGGWSRYAAIWKSHADSNVGSVNFGSAYAGGNFDPLLGADATLDLHESLYFEDIWGVTYDPNGTWYSVDIDDPMTGLAYAAIAMHYWGTPVFVSGDYQPSPWIAPSGSWYGDIAVEQLSFSSPAFTSLLDACGILATDSASDALYKIYNSTSPCGLTGVTLTGGVISAWAGDYSPVQAPDLLHHHGVTGAELIAAYGAGYTWSPGFSSGRVGELVLDPPAGADLESVELLAKAIGEQMQEQLELGELVAEEAVPEPLEGLL